MKRGILFILFAAVLSTAVYMWWINHSGRKTENELLIYGNVDLRQVNLAFNGNERILTLLVQEGDLVKKGQVLGTLEMERLKSAVARAEARVQAQSQVVKRLENGTRPEEIEQARANVQASQTDLENARRVYDRFKRSAVSGASSQQDLDTAKTAVELADSRLRVNQNALKLAVSGPRQEEIAEAHAVLRANEADLAVLQQDLVNATLVSPTDGVLQNRILEPGEMASPQRPVLTIAITDPKWVRAYIPQPDLGRIHQGMSAFVTSDSFPGRRYEAWVGFISPVAEFTPRSVETTELRTSLVYEVRVFVNDPANELRLGMPTTVTIPLDASQATTGSTEKRDG
jgi:HlyD family secretion protein